MSDDPRSPQHDPLDAAIALLGDGRVRELLAGLDRADTEAIATTLGLPPAALRRAREPAALLRRRLARRPVEVGAGVARILISDCLDDTITLLGDAAGDPSRDDLLGVLDDVVERHGVDRVRLLLASMVAPDARARAVCAEILATDERFVVHDVPPLPDATRRLAPARPVGARAEPVAAEPERAEARARRRALKEAKKQARRREQERRERVAAALRERRRSRRKG